MANDSMGNLEKLGILVIVILVVVVGVVAITPTRTLFQTEPGPEDLDVAGLENGATDFDAERDGEAANDLYSWPPRPAHDVRPDDGSAAAPLPLPIPTPTPPANSPAVPGPDATHLVPPTPAPVVVQPVTPPAPAPVTTPRFREYTVRSGDSLSKIAGLQSPPMRWTDIYRANPGIDPNAIKPGQVLKIPSAAARGAEETVRRETATTPIRRTPAEEPRTGATTHVVRKGESLSSIAGRLLGSRKSWRKIYDANRDVISDPDQVPAGLTLRIPSSNASGSASTSGTRRDISSNAGAAIPRYADVPAGGGHTYEVQRGDNLSRIAARFLGDADRWREIFDANRDLISAPEKLRADITIQIP